jgi:Leucine-rich repeat (LRR) protein
MSTLAANAFTAALEVIPAENWCRTWAAGRTIMLRMTSKRVKELVDKVCPPADVRLSRSFWNDARYGHTAAQKRDHVLAQLAAMKCRITRLELPSTALLLAGMTASCDEHFGADGTRLAGVLVPRLQYPVRWQCPALTHLNLSGNHIGAEETRRLAGVLAQCPALAHLNLSGNQVDDYAAERLAGGLTQCLEMSHLNLSCNQIGAEGALAEVLAQFRGLAHLNLSWNLIFDDGAWRLAEVLTQCPALAHLDLSHNCIGARGSGKLRASWLN